VLQDDENSKRESTGVFSLLLSFAFRSGLGQKYVSFPPYNTLRQRMHLSNVLALEAYGMERKTTFKTLPHPIQR
jgi:hypothetical protein